MNSRLGKSLAIAAVLAATPALAQDMPDIGFKSVGRGRPLAASVHDQQPVGPGWIGDSFQRRDDQKLDGFFPDELPKGVEALPVDISRAPISTLTRSSGATRATSVATARWRRKCSGAF